MLHNYKFFIIGTVFTAFYCEFLMYYIAVARCSWPQIPTSDTGNALRAFILADIHMLGPRRGHWLDKWRREWQMHRAYQSIMTLFHPDVVFILGDIFDEGEWTNEREFKEYVERFYKLFSVPQETPLYVVAGNHDIGFHHNIRRGFAERFSKVFKAPSVQFLTLKDNHFVMINSMALHGDSCNLCTEARRSINNVTDVLQCSQDPDKCGRVDKVKYSRPIILQHFPLYRQSDRICTEPDAPPLPERNVRFRNKIDALSKEATDYLVHKLKPRSVFGGHTHHGCLVQHSYEQGAIEFDEHSVPSFSWRNRLDPKYMLVTFTPGAYAVNKCALPTEITIIATAVIFMCTVICLLIFRRISFLC